ncbi:MAG: glycosyltransferase family 2 protein [Candidatus Micrarchaeia archaeon]
MDNLNDYSDSTVIVPIKDEPAVNLVIKDIAKNMPKAKIMVIYKGNNTVWKRYSKTVKVIEQQSSGKGNACYEAVKKVNTEIVCFIDGDATYHAEDLAKLVSIIRNGADLAIGDRLSNIKNPKVMPRYVLLGNRILTKALNIFYGTKIKDSQTGLRAIKRNVFNALKLTEPGFGFEEEMLIKAKRLGFSIKEIPIKYSEREGISKQMKPIDGVKLLLILIKHIFD